MILAWKSHLVILVLNLDLTSISKVSKWCLKHRKIRLRNCDFYSAKTRQVRKMTIIIRLRSITLIILRSHVWHTRLARFSPFEILFGLQWNRSKSKFVKTRNCPRNRHDVASTLIHQLSLAWLTVVFRISSRHNFFK